MGRLDVITDDQPTEVFEPPDLAERGDAPPGSVLARLRAQAAARRGDASFDVAIWDGELVLRYAHPAMEDVDRLVAATARLAGPEAASVSMTDTSIDVMMTCCQTVLGSDGEGGFEDLQVGLTWRLAQMLELPRPVSVEYADLAPREVVGALFFDNWIAVNVHAGRVMSWLQEGVGEPGEEQPSAER